MRVARKQLLNGRQFRIQLSQADDPIKVFRSVFRASQKQLYRCHLAGATAQDIVSSRSWLTDQALIFAWRHLSNKDLDIDRSALIAVGGYGRGELNPHSDIDILILFRSNPNSVERDFSESFIRFLWDIGLQVGHSVRSLKNCISQAKTDVTVMTNLMECRYIFGSNKLTVDLESQLGIKAVWPVEKYFQAKWDEQLARHLRYNDTAFNLEPHLKEGPGGLRDIQTISWVTQRHFGSRKLHSLISHNFLTKDECRSLIRGRNLLWKIRNALHFLSNRCEDRLLFDYQVEIATQFGYVNDADSLAVEKFMKRYYRTVKGLRCLNEMLLQHFREEILYKNRKKIVDINRRFRTVDGFIATKNSSVFKNQPFALLEIFAFLQQRPDLQGVRADTIRQIRSSLHLIDSSFRQDIRCRSLFMELMRSPSGQTHSLRRMNDYGILGAYIPNFGRVVGQMQHDLFHFFTVDAHLLFVVRNLRRLEIDEFSHELPFASSIMRSVFKRHRIFLAALFHDIAKGRGGDHAELGEKEAYNFCQLHDLSEYDSKFVAWLVRHHLLMSWVAQREDISDPNVVTRFAETIGDHEHLDSLYLLTVADIRGTNPHLWNDWKGQLLIELYHATSRSLQRGLEVAPIKLNERVSDIRVETLRLLDQEQPIMNAAKRYWDTLDTDYFLRYRPEVIAWHTSNLLATPLTDLPLVTVRSQPDSQTAQFLFCAPDSDLNFSRITASFDKQNMSIIDARVHRTRSGLVMMIFIVLITSAKLRTTENLEASASLIRKLVLDPQSNRSNRQSKLTRRIKHFPIKTEVVFSDKITTNHTMMEVIAQDRRGLLHQVANALLQCKVRLVNARISTFGERAEDIFLITDRDGNAVRSQAQKNCLSRQILKRLPSN